MITVISVNCGGEMLTSHVREDLGPVQTDPVERGVWKVVELTPRQLPIAKEASDTSAQKKSIQKDVLGKEILHASFTNKLGILRAITETIGAYYISFRRFGGGGSPG
jgi:hypothetical protein